MRHTTISFVAMAVLAAGAGTVATVRSAPVAETARKVYLSALDASGAAVTDLKATDITVKENGKPYAVASVEPVSGMNISLIVDDQGTGAFQGAVATFVQKLAGKAQFRVYALNQQAIMLNDFTADPAKLKDAIANVAQRQRQASSMDQILEAITPSAKAMQQRKGERGVIIAMTLGGGQPSTNDPKNVLGTLRASGAVLHTLFTTGADLGEVLQDGAKQTGGRLEEANTSMVLVPSATKLADILLHQYVVSYALPDGVKMSDKVTIETSRKDIKLLAPTRIPDK